MIRTSRWAALTLLALVTVGCASTAGGTAILPSPDRTAAAASARGTDPDAVAAGITGSSASSPETSAATITPAPEPGTTTTTTPPAGLVEATTGSAEPGATADHAALGVCSDVTPSDDSAVEQCLGRSLAGFWSTRLGLTIDDHVVVDPAAESVPAACRSALTMAPAFTCPVDNAVYLDPKLTTLVDGHFAATDRTYALAVVLSHEFGHVVQAQVKQAGYGDSSPTASRRIEQQADCLSGVWASRQSSLGQLDTTRFTAIQHTLITAISDQAETTSHGTPTERASALARGLQNGHQQDCALSASTTGPVA